MTDTTVSKPSSADDRYVALVNYGLLFASIFVAGVPAVVAVVIAYAHRDAASKALRSHYDFQIRIFWISFALTMLAVICAIVAVVMGVGELIRFGGAGGWDAWTAFSLETNDVKIDGNVVVLVLVAALAFVVSVIWLMAAPAFGFIRLASERRIGQQAP